MKIDRKLLPSWYVEKKFLPGKYWEKRLRILSFFLRCFQRMLFFLPVKKNRVMVYIHQRRGISCNPKYVVRKLKEKYGNKLEIIWVTSYPETCKELRDMGILVAATNSKLHVSLYMRTRVFVTNDSVPTWAVHRPGQIWMNTWHGGMNYKRIGYEHVEPMSRDGFCLYKLENRSPDVYLAGSEYFRRDTARSFSFSEDIFQRTGMPRNDLFFEKRDDIREKVVRRYDLAVDQRIVLYAPTFRRNMENSTYGLDFGELIRTLSARFGGDWLVFFHNHNFVRSGQKLPEGVIDVSDYDDMQELLYVVDVLISDYSSCMWDYCLTGRPCFVYASDVEEYITKDRTLGFPMEQWPYPIAGSNQDLMRCIRRFDEREYESRVAKHLEDMGSYDRGDASERAAELIGSYCIEDV